MTRGNFFKKGASLLALILLPFETIPILSQAQDTVKNNKKINNEKVFRDDTKKQNKENLEYLKEKNKMEIFIPNRKVKLTKRADGK